MLLLGNSLADIDGASAHPVAAKASQAPPADFNAALATGRNLERAGKYDQARPIYERLVAEYPKRYEPYHRLAVVADHQRRHREAEALYAQAIRLCGTDPELFNDLGYCLYLQGKLEKAEAALLKAVSLRPAGSRYRNNLGLVLGHLGRPDEALEEFRRAGSEADAYYNLAFVHASQEDVGKAKECFRLALSVDPAHEPARLALASFDRYDEDPHGLPDDVPVATAGVRWVPYTEDSRPDVPDEGGPDAQNELLWSGGTAASARPSTQTLLKRARALMARRTTQRQE
jgi:Tfp pilus assembly protein PilF